MTGLVLFPDTEELIGGYLTEALARYGRPVPVSTLAPDAPERATARQPAYVRLQVIGGLRTGLVTEDATLTLEAYDDGGAKAASLAGLVRALLHAAPESAALPVYAVQEYSRPQSLPDPRTGLSRYTQTVSLRIRGTALQPTTTP